VSGSELGELTARARVELAAVAASLDALATECDRHADGWLIAHRLIRAAEVLRALARECGNS
jgi:hypothetical protein